MRWLHTMHTNTISFISYLLFFNNGLIVALSNKQIAYDGIYITSHCDNVHKQFKSCKKFHFVHLESFYSFCYHFRLVTSAIWTWMYCDGRKRFCSNARKNIKSLCILFINSLNILCAPVHLDWPKSRLIISVELLHYLWTDTINSRPRHRKRNDTMKRKCAQEQKQAWS